MLVPQHGSSLGWDGDRLPNYHNLSENNVSAAVNDLAAGTDLDSLASTIGDSGSITNDIVVGSTLNLAPPPVQHVSINYSADGLTTYFTLMSYFMGITERGRRHFYSHLRQSGFSGVGNSSKCYGALGCLNITESWFGLARPVNLLPLDREAINTQFLLRTRDSYGVSERELNAPFG